MPTIANPKPVRASTFSRMWVTNMEVFLPSAVMPRGRLAASLLPYDGTTLLAIGRKVVAVTLPAVAAQTADMVASLIAEVKRRSGKDVDVSSIIITANDPQRPVVATIGFLDKSCFKIEDCFALAATDAVFAGVLGAVLAEVARLAGLPLQP